VSAIHTALFTPIRAIVALCSREGILASDLTRFPLVAAKIPSILAPSQFSHTVTELQRILDARESLGFTLLDQNGLKQLVATKPGHVKEQTEYIPPRILAYQRNRLRECLDDYMLHKTQVEDCFNFCVDAYAKNYGSLTAAVTNATRHSRFPFQAAPCLGSGKKTNCQFHGHFSYTATRFGIKNLMERWVGELASNKQRRGIKQFTVYLSLVRDVGLAYLLNFSLMRQAEGRSLRTNCLYIENDEKLGKIPILCGETTKTDPDSDARWPTSPNAIIAIDAMTSVARMRMRCARANPKIAPSVEDIANPYLFDRRYEPWSGGITESPSYTTRPAELSYSKFVAAYPKLFDVNELIITKQDLQIARSVCPTLNAEIFQEGKPWQLAWHQLRRTGAVDMFASGVISDSTMQYQLKHRSRQMPLYYGRGSSKLALNAGAQALLVNVQYEVMGLELSAVLSDRFVSPHGDAHKKQLVADLLGEDVALITEKDANHFETAARNGAISFRATVLGACMKSGKCNGDCIESIANCSGGTRAPPCRDVLFDRQRAGHNKARLESINLQIQSAQPNSPRYSALAMEQRGLENYFAYINRGW
jgi:hypothetical protein